MAHAIPLPARHLCTYEWCGHTILEFHGEIDIAAAAEIRPLLDAATAGPRPRVVIDLTPTTFLDCSGLRLLCRAHRRVHKRDGRLALVCPHPAILRLLDILRLTDAFDPVATYAEALGDAAVRGQAEAPAGQAARHTAAHDEAPPAG
ncbi:STAS domain-containing protein [Streptomyces sp. ODS28]|uniref:STAS domain-containing protein n=1 Tax=Streptomyces sp. ODS28 TaxID=3136688 RepID=UPI0031F17B75